MMSAAERYQRKATARDRHFFQNPALWPNYPFLPVVRRPVGQAEAECGVLYDALGMSGHYGYSATVFLVNLLQLPRTEAEFLALPRRVYDTFFEMADDGWTVD
jgi:hypothetical protein